MVNTLVIVAVLLLGLTFVLLFRVQSLMAVLRGTDKDPAGGNGLNKLNAFLCLAFIVAGTLAFLYYTYALDYTLPVASEHGVKTDKLFNNTMVIISVACILTNILLMYFAWRYQRRKGQKARFFPENQRLETAWTIVPAIVLTFLVVSGWKVWTGITDPDQAYDVKLEVMGKQFAWQVRYPGADQELGEHDFRLIGGTNEFGLDVNNEASWDDFMPPEIHLPVGKTVLFQIRARDVLHSVYAPHFRVKMDAVPGMPTKFFFKPTVTTAEMREQLGNEEFNYELACAEICGRGHNSMRLIIVVESEEEYNEWYASQDAASFAKISRSLAEETLDPEKLERFLKRYPQGGTTEPAAAPTDTTASPEVALLVK